MNTEPNQPAPNSGDSLQFERAEFAGAQALSCASCKGPIESEYYQINGQSICPKCRANLGAFSAGGSGSVRLIKAVGAGLLAGVVGFVGYYAILKLTGYNLGLIAIAVGWLVGMAVRWGSEARGGALYQVLAAGITYVAACATYAPDIYESLQQEGGGSIGKVIISFLFSQVAPWLAGTSNIIGWVILGFAIYQAWIMNRKMNLEVSGPFFTRQATPPAAS